MLSNSDQRKPNHRGDGGIDQVGYASEFDSPIRALYSFRGVPSIPLQNHIRTTPHSFDQGPVVVEEGTHPAYASISYELLLAEDGFAHRPQTLLNQAGEEWTPLDAAIWVTESVGDWEPRAKHPELQGSRTPGMPRTLTGTVFGEWVRHNELTSSER